MKAVRLGSYSRRSTVASPPNFRRLKSTIRYRRLWPPPRRRAVMCPWLLRPPVPRMPSVRSFSGSPFHSCERSTLTMPRRPGVVGLNVFSAIVFPAPSDARHDVDGLAFGERHHGLLRFLLAADGGLERLNLAL